MFYNIPKMSREERESVIERLSEEYGIEESFDTYAYICSAIAVACSVEIDYYKENPEAIEDENDIPKLESLLNTLQICSNTFESMY